MKRKDPMYLAWVREQACVGCGAPAPSAPHHPRGYMYGSGMSLKAPDSLAVPVCKKCHDAYHDKTLDDPQGTQLDWVVRTMIKALERGIFVRNAGF